MVITLRHKYIYNECVHVVQRYDTLAENKHVPKIHDTYDPT